MDSIQLPTLFRCKLLIGINLVVFVCYKILLHFHFVSDYLDVRMFLCVSFCWSVQKCYKNVVEYLAYYNPDVLINVMKKMDKTLKIVIYNQGLVSSIVISSSRIIGQILIEFLSLRYGSNGFMLMGSFGILHSTCETPEQNLETIKTFGVSPYPIVINNEALIEVPSVPPRNI